MSVAIANLKGNVELRSPVSFIFEINSVSLYFILVPFNVHFM